MLKAVLELDECYCCCFLVTPIAYCTTHDNRTYWMYLRPMKHLMFEGEGDGDDDGDGIGDGEG